MTTATKNYSMEHAQKTQTFDGLFNFVENDGLISFVNEKQKERLGDYFDIKVGAVSGADKYFQNDNGIDFVYSKTRTNGTLKKMIYQKYDKSLEQYKNILIARGIKTFDEDTWYMWGRPVDFREGSPRIYVNCKTRIEKPFFINKCERWDGSVLALFPKKDIDSGTEDHPSEYSSPEHAVSSVLLPPQSPLCLQVLRGDPLLRTGPFHRSSCAS